MEIPEAKQKTLKWFLENNVGSFIYLNGLFEMWKNENISESIQLPILIDLSSDGFIELFPPYSATFNGMPKQAKITLRGIEKADSSKLLVAAEKEIFGMKITHFKRTILFAVCAYVFGVLSPVATDLVRKWTGLNESENKQPLQLQIQSNLVYKDTVFLFLKDTSLVRLVKAKTN